MERFWKCDSCGKVFLMVTDEEGEPSDIQDECPCPKCGGLAAVEVEQ